MFGKYRNSKEIRIIKGVPTVIHTDSYGDILSVETASNVEDYNTRNSLYNLDVVTYEKFLRGDFKYTNVDIGLVNEIKGKRLEDVEDFLK